MRFYGFGNYYLSSIQQGIQAAHVISTMSIFYKEATQQKKVYNEWAKFHSTIILCNGGNSASLSNLYAFLMDLEAEGMNLPYNKFNEDSQSLDGALTAVGIVLPKKLYEFDPNFISADNASIFESYIANKSNKEEFMAQGKILGYEPWESELMFRVKGYSLAK